MWYNNLSPLYQNLIASVTFALFVWLGKKVLERISLPVIVPAKLRKHRNVHQIFRFAIYKWAITSKDTRKSFDGVFFLASHSFIYFLYACLVLSFYFGVLSLRNGDVFAFIVCVCIAVLIRESKLWLTKPSDEQMTNIDPEFKDGVLEYFHSVQYEDHDGQNNERANGPNNRFGKRRE